jgi:hypothetical protein
MNQPTRQCQNWLEELNVYINKTESPKHFWMWSGIFILCAAMQRKIWLPFGIDALFPNVYVLLVAPPGRCRKGSPISLAHKFLNKVEIPIAVDSSSKRTITKEMAELSKVQQFEWEGSVENHCSIAIISKELSSLLALDPKGIIELLTDLYDSHQIWQYKTSTQGNDYLYGVCINAFLATTPGWMADNLPANAIDGGWASRAIIVYGDEKDQRITLPPPPPVASRKKLLHDLGIISQLKGPFAFHPTAFQIFDKWYNSIDSKYTWVNDRRIYPFIERMHIHVLKVAMALHVAYSNELIMLPGDMNVAISMIETILVNCSKALGGHGRAELGGEVHKVLEQIRRLKKVSLRQLIRMNYTDATYTDFDEITKTIKGMDCDIKDSMDQNGETWFEVKEGGNEKT